MTLVDSITIRRLGRGEYLATLAAMKDFTSRRNGETADELWLLEHPPVYTLGQGAQHAPVGNGIPLVRSDRGGDITYHGPGQLVVYALVDLARRGIKVRQFVALLEQAVIDLLAGRGERRAGAPGVYVEGAKIAALGIRVRQGRAYHGLSLNVDMDLAPFSLIDPCGYPGLAVTQTKAIGMNETLSTLGERLAVLLAEKIEHA
ncbi:MAG TPA: lipoyl(octanoyl) transferase LipB [Burkholderiales bacterium]|nr:lipoyl(octanoyl) transferase LipB [Burkholderiales bacterium]